MIIFAHTISSRLQYICNFIFTEYFGLEIKFSSDTKEFKQAVAAKINYSTQQFDEHCFKIVPVSLLSETHITPQKITCFQYIDYPAFFRTEGGIIPFDIFAASFYLVSRYEEYLHFTPDVYGRFPHQASLAWQHNFLNIPLVNIWLQHFGKQLQYSFPELTFKPQQFSWLPTYDIDIAYSYLHKGFMRNVGGFLKKPGLERLQVVLLGKKDPYDCYEWLHHLHDAFQLKPIYFFLAATKNAQYDKQILPDTKAMQQLIATHAKKYSIGLHPSWQSNAGPATLLAEKVLLERLASQPIIHSRQHYIKMQLPETYQSLLAAGIQHDYSMGYGSINGFRASYAGSFYWYNLVEECATVLCIHPFCFMDANSFFEQKQNIRQTAAELNEYFMVCKQVEGKFITIFHNNILGSAASFTGVAPMYAQFVKGWFTNS